MSLEELKVLNINMSGEERRGAPSGTYFPDYDHSVV